MKIKLNENIKGLSIALMALFLVALPVSEASARKVKGYISLGNLSGKCTANIGSNKRKRTKVTCYLSGKVHGFNVRVGKVTRTHPKRKVTLKINKVRRGTKTLRFRATLRKKGKKKTKSQTVRLR